LTQATFSEQYSGSRPPVAAGTTKSVFRNTADSNG
jgi:hypothetical protein